MVDDRRTNRPVQPSWYPFDGKPVPSTSAHSDWAAPCESSTREKPCAKPGRQRVRSRPVAGEVRPASLPRSSSFVPCASLCRSLLLACRCLAHDVGRHGDSRLEIVYGDPLVMAVDRCEQFWSEHERTPSVGGGAARPEEAAIGDAG